ncbi:hypothetical protein RF11_03354 [Thelohanellus kitauei]|uniref:Uncharacterized protein n=1 Tax=Thelohanellus kitauei TaxID=669202 RepID=A0A0C2MKS0_THEKT|nr:hypothetical protein RF11_03354 [Thelohanellus kitauei]
MFSWCESCTILTACRRVPPWGTSLQVIETVVFEVYVMSVQKCTGAGSLWTSTGRAQISGSGAIDTLDGPCCPLLTCCRYGLHRLACSKTAGSSTRSVFMSAGRGFEYAK